VASLALSACTRREPPQWDAGPGASLAVAALPGTDAAAIVQALAEAGTDAAKEPTKDAPPPNGDAIGKLPQTHDVPKLDALFESRARALFEAIALDDPERAMPFFFPLPAYQQVKAIANPSADWRARLVAHFARDVHAAHAKLGALAEHATFDKADVPMDRARWVEPNEEYNRIGYFRVYGTKLRGTSDGKPIAIDVTSLISWRGEWFCVHLTGVK